MSRNAIIAWDDTPSAHHALDWAVDWWGAAAVVLLQVGSRDEAEAEVFAAGSRAATARVRLIEAAEHARSRYPGADIETRFERGDATDVLAAASTPDVCVVLGTSRDARGDYRYAWSVASKVAAIATGPVAVVPTFGAGRHEAQAHRNEVVVGIDGSIGEMELVRSAAQAATRSGSDLTIVHAWTTSVLTDVEESFAGDALAGLRDEHTGLLAATVRDVETEFPALSVTPLLTEDDPATAIAAAGRGAALVVLGRHGVSRFRRLFLGSVSHSVLLDIPAPILVLPLRPTE